MYLVVFTPNSQVKHRLWVKIHLLHFKKYPETPFISHSLFTSSSFHISSISSCLVASLSLFFPSVTLKQSEAGERTDCTHRHSNAVLMMATSVTWRFDLRASGRGMGCEATAQLTSQFCPLICFPLTSPSTYSSVSALFLFSGSQ